MKKVLIVLALVIVASALLVSDRTQASNVCSDVSHVCTCKHGATGLGICWACAGSGNGPFACSACNGSGLINGFTCHVCNGRGRSKCTVCGGTGQH